MFLQRLRTHCFQIPENLKATAKDGTIQLEWDASKSADCTYYKLYRKEAEAQEYTLLHTLHDRYQTTYMDKLVEEEESYIYALVAGDVFGNESEFTAPVLITVDKDMEAPEVESMMPKAGRIHQVTEIAVTATDNRGVTKIRLQYKGEQAEEWTDLAEVTATNYGELLSRDSSLTHFLYNGRCGVSTDANGLYYMRQRYYNPEIKRFVNQDILTGNLSNSQSLNQYSYVQGNPVSYTDPFGLSPVNGLFSSTNFAHGFFGLLSCIPGPVGAVASLADAAVYFFIDKDYGMAALCAVDALTFGMGKIATALAKGGKMMKTAKVLKTSSSLISNATSFGVNAVASYNVGSQMYDKYVVQGQALDSSTGWEALALGLNVAGCFLSGKGLSNDTKQMGRMLQQEGVGTTLKQKFGEFATRTKACFASNGGFADFSYRFERGSSSYYFRGTTEGYAGNPSLQRAEVTPTSTDPLVSTVFATNGEQYGKGIVYICSTNDLKGVSTTAPNRLSTYEKEVCFNILPLAFADRASISISASDARAILKDMGYDIPSRITRGDMSEFLSNAPTLSVDEVMMFVKKAGGMQ